MTASLYSSSRALFWVQAEPVAVSCPNEVVYEGHGKSGVIAVIPDELLENVALGKIATQSSYSQFSRSDDPQGAINGIKTGGFGFHTDLEVDPWWQVDLLRPYRIERIVIYNRQGDTGRRARTLSVAVAPRAAGPWRQVYAGLNVFGGIGSGHPIHINLDGEVDARCIRVQLHGPGILHLDQVEVFACPTIENYRPRIEQSLEAAGRPEATDDSTSDADEVRSGGGAIVGLVRGYTDAADYGGLIRRNRSIWQRINRHRAQPYPLIIFHEGDISAEDQGWILSVERNPDVRFVDAGESFRAPRPSPDAARLLDDAPLGYRLMCFFNSWTIWQQTRMFDFILRIDDDCTLEQVEQDPIDWLQAHDLDFGAARFTPELHPLTVATLPRFVDAFVDAVHPALPAGSYFNDTFPYTNVYVARTAFFLRRDVQQFLRAVTHEPDFLRLRWGDLPVLGLALNMFGDPARIRHMTGLAYDHESHMVTVDSVDPDRTPGRPVTEFDHPRDEIAKALMERSNRYAATGRLREAENDAQLAHLVEPASPAIAWTLGRIAERAGNSTKTAYWLGQARDLASGRPVPADLNLALGSAHAALEQYRDAVTSYADMFASKICRLAEQAQDYAATLPADSVWKGWRAPDTILPVVRSNESVFTRFYEMNVWGIGLGSGSAVPVGSLTEAGFVQHLLRTRGIRKVVEIGCGDWRIGRTIDWSETDYVGIDIVAKLIEANTAAFGSERISFVHADATTLAPIEADLVLCKDVLQHLTHEAALKILSLRQAGSIWLVTNDFHPVNRPCRTGDTSPINLAAPPFSIPARPVLESGGKVTFMIDREAAALPYPPELDAAQLAETLLAETEEGSDGPAD